MKLLENKIQEQSKEISIRSKTIEELQYSLNLLIGKYNELKNKYDGLIIEVKEIPQKKIAIKFGIVNEVTISFKGDSKMNSMKEIENENIRLKHKLNLSEDEFNQILLKKNNEIDNLERLLEAMKEKIANLNTLEDTIKTNEKKFEELSLHNQSIMKELSEINQNKENFIKKYHKYKTKYIKMQSEVSQKTQNFKVIHEEVNNL